MQNQEGGHWDKKNLMRHGVRIWHTNMSEFPLTLNTVSRVLGTPSLPKWGVLSKIEGCQNLKVSYGKNTYYIVYLHCSTKLHLLFKITCTLY